MFAIHYPNSDTIAKTYQGSYHIYPSKEEAEQVAAELGEGYTVRPWREE